MSLTKERTELELVGRCLINKKKVGESTEPRRIPVLTGNERGRDLLTLRNASVVEKMIRSPKRWWRWKTGSKAVQICSVQVSFCTCSTVDPDVRRITVDHDFNGEVEMRIDGSKWNLSDTIIPNNWEITEVMKIGQQMFGSEISPCLIIEKVMESFQRHRKVEG